MLKEGFVFLDEAVPGALWDAKYAGCDNFVGEVIDGYCVNRVAGAAELADGLRRAEALARARGLTLLLWDGYRPARAVRHFVRWAKAPESGRTKRAHYPNIDKADIIPGGYVCEKSGHSRGGAIDLTLASLFSGEALDMGGIFDFMDEASHHGAPGISARAAQNRALLCGIMEEAGFLPYECEWWHYALQNEPYPDAYFDFPIR